MFKRFISTVLEALFSNKPFFGMVLFVIVGGFVQFAEGGLWILWLCSLAFLIFFQTSYTWRMDFPDESLLWSIILIFSAIYAAPYLTLVWFLIGVIRHYLKKWKAK